MNTSVIGASVSTIFTSEPPSKPSQLSSSFPTPSSLPPIPSVPIPASSVPVSAEVELTKEIALKLFAPPSSRSSTSSCESATGLIPEYGESFRIHYAKLQTLFNFLKIDLPQDFGCLTPDQIVHLGLPTIVLAMFRNKPLSPLSIKNSELAQDIALNIFVQIVDLENNSACHAKVSMCKMEKAEQFQGLVELLDKLSSTLLLDPVVKKILVECFTAVWKLKMNGHPDAFYSRPLMLTAENALSTGQATLLKYSEIMTAVSHLLLQGYATLTSRFEGLGMDLNEQKKIIQQFKSELKEFVSLQEKAKYNYYVKNNHFFLKIFKGINLHIHHPLTNLSRECSRLSDSLHSNIALVVQLERIIWRGAAIERAFSIQIPKLEGYFHEMENQVKQPSKRLPDTEIVRDQQNPVTVLEILASSIDEWQDSLSNIRELCLDKNGTENFMSLITHCMRSDPSKKDLAYFIRSGIPAKTLEILTKKIQNKANAYIARAIKSSLAPTDKKTAARPNALDKRDVSSTIEFQFLEYKKRLLPLSIAIARTLGPRAPLITIVSSIYQWLRKMQKLTVEGESDLNPSISPTMMVEIEANFKAESKKYNLEKANKLLGKKVGAQSLLNTEIHKSFLEDTFAILKKLCRAMRLIESLMGTAHDLKSLFLEDARLQIDLPYSLPELSDFPEIATGKLVLVKKGKKKKKTVTIPALPLPPPQEALSKKASDALSTSSSSSSEPSTFSITEQMFAHLLTDTSMHFEVSPYLDTLNREFTPITAARYDQWQAIYQVTVIHEMLQSARCYIDEVMPMCIERTLIPTLRHQQYLAIERYKTAEMLILDPTARLYHDLFYMTNGSKHPLIRELQRETLEMRYPKHYERRKVTPTSLNPLIVGFFEVMGKSLPENEDRQKSLEALRKEMNRGYPTIGAQPRTSASLAYSEGEQKHLEELSHNFNGLCHALSGHLKALSPHEDEKAIVVSKMCKHLESLSDAANLIRLFPEQRYLLISMLPIALAAQHVFESLGRYLLIVKKGQTEDSIFEQLRSEVHDLRFLCRETALDSTLTERQRATLWEFNLFKGSEYLHGYLSGHSKSSASPLLLLMAELSAWSKAGNGFAPRDDRSGKPVEVSVAALRRRMAEHLNAAAELAHILIHQHVLLSGLVL